MNPSENSTWEAPVLAEDRAVDMETLRDLRADPGVAVVDRLVDQMKELRAVLPSPGPELLDEAPRWVHYPWRRTVVRVLGPRSFRRLRFDRNRNKLTMEEQDRLHQRTVGVVGLSAGSAVAQALALDGLCGTLRLADFDVIELSNLNRVPGSLVDLGVNKAVVAARRLAELDPYLELCVWPDGVRLETAGAFVDGLDVLVDECDSFDTKFGLRIEAAKRGVPVVMATSDRGLIDVERFDLDAATPFHGLFGDLRPERLATLSSREKIPFALRLLGADRLSPRMGASLLEIDRSLTTWPQLGSDVMLGGAAVAAAVRRIGLGMSLRSGRSGVDIEDLLDGLASPAGPVTASGRAADVDSPPDDPIDRVLYAAGRAPSGGNSQPWSISADGAVLTVALATDFVPTAIDIRCRGAYVALGAALQNVRIAAAAHGILGPVRLAEDHPGGTGRPFATMEFADGADPALAAQYDRMLARGTNRRMCDGSLLSETDVEALHAAARQEGGDVRVVVGAENLTAIAEVLAESDRIRYLTETLRREMVAELRWPATGDLESGIDVDALGLDDVERTMLEVALRNDVLDQLEKWDLGQGLGRITGERLLRSAAMIVVTAPGPDPIDYVRAGMVAESVWICAHGLGLAVQPTSPVFLYAEDDDDLVRLCAPRVDAVLRLRSALDLSLGTKSGERYAILLRVGRGASEPIRSARRSDRVRRS
ncbi:Rv1355c family protein [Rhodococcus zopfii]|uniref:Rv1355c family protein n=1 Tax=Rhodococcus zopfii TaxID=43772 RepID=UPI000932C01E|nr:Rv1355c family protein [Rhodococcus zopfii]